MTDRTDAGFAVRAGVIDALTGIAALKAITGNEDRVWEYVDAGAKLNYLQVLNDDDQDWSTSGESDGVQGELEFEPNTEELVGNQHTFTVHNWTDAKGAHVSEQINRIVRDSLHNASLDITSKGHRLVTLRFLSGGVLREPTDNSYHGFARFRATTEEI